MLGAVLTPVSKKLFRTSQADENRLNCRRSSMSVHNDVLATQQKKCRSDDSSLGNNVH